MQERAVTAERHKVVTPGMEPLPGREEVPTPAAGPAKTQIPLWSTPRGREIRSNMALAFSRRDMRRLPLLPAFVVRDLASRRPSVPAPTVRAVTQAVEAGVSWLAEAHEVTGRRGCAKGFSLLFGWQRAFPETSGYIIGTFLDYAERAEDPSYAQRARELGDWEIEVQNPDGGVVVGLWTGQPKPSTVFNTGMVIHGWLDLHERGFDDRGDYLDAASRAGRYLTTHQDADGAWRGECEYHGIPHVYSVRVAWALLRLAKVTGERQFLDAGRRQLDWVLSMQRPNGWFDACTFRPALFPNTHLIAYTLRGLFEGYLDLGDERYLAAVRTTSDALIDKLTVLGRLPASYDSAWKPVQRHECLTGYAQLGAIWLRLHVLLADERYLDAGRRALGLATARQCTYRWRPVFGALPGSFPVSGRYAPLQYPNWATKFLVDGLLTYERTAAGRAAGQST